MTHNIETAHVGVKFYTIALKNNVMNRRKIHMVDASGITWYRYDKVLHEYRIVEYVLLGRTYTRVMGEFPNDDDIREEEFYVHNVTDDKKHFFYDHSDSIYYDFLEASRELEHLREETRKLEAT